MYPSNPCTARRSKPLRRWFATLGLTTALAGLVHAQQPSDLQPLPGDMMANPATPTDIWHRAYLTGDPGHYRSNLADHGVTFDLENINDIFGVVAGDQFKGHDDDWNRTRLTIDIDFGKLARINGLSFHVSGLNQFGGNTGADIGSNANPSSLVSAQTTRIDTYWLQQKLFNGVIVLRLGQLAQQDDYGVQEYGGSYLLEPLGYAYGNLFSSVNAQFDPASKPGVELQIHPYGGFYAKAEFLNGQSNPYGNQDQHGVGFDTGGPGLLASEIGFRHDDPSQWPVYKPGMDGKDGKDGKASRSMAGYQAGPRWFWEGTLPEVYKVGMYNNFGDFSSLKNGDSIHQNYLVYGSINQGIYRESHYGPGYFRGLDAFIGGDYSPGVEASTSYQVTAGLRYTGLIPTRDKDTLAFGYVHSHLSPYVNTPSSAAAGVFYSYENAFEINYSCQVTGWLLVQPTVEIFDNPGGIKSRDTDVLIGARTKVVF